MRGLCIFCGVYRVWVDMSLHLRAFAGTDSGGMGVNGEEEVEKGGNSGTLRVDSRLGLLGDSHTRCELLAMMAFIFSVDSFTACIRRPKSFIVFRERSVGKALGGRGLPCA